MNEKKQLKKDPSQDTSPTKEARAEESLSLPAVKRLIDQELAVAKQEVLNQAKATAQEEISKQIQTAQAFYMTVFGIFASILSLLTVEFQFLSKLERPAHIAGLTMILLASLLGFNITLDCLAKNMFTTSRWSTALFATLTTLLIGIGMWLVMH